jgi:hypothetical protein
MSARKFVVWDSVRDEYGNYSWCVNDGLVFVRTPFGQKCTQVGGSPPHFIARLLARELSSLAPECEDC